jgi:hypothetical protein
MHPKLTNFLALGIIDRYVYKIKLIHSQYGAKFRYDSANQN